MTRTTTKKINYEIDESSVFAKQNKTKKTGMVIMWIFFLFRFLFELLPI